MEETSCADCIHSRMYPSEVQEMPVFKCHRYPPVVFFDHDNEPAQSFPDAWMTCGEFTPAKKTGLVIGTLRKVRNEQLARNYARRVLSNVRRILDRSILRNQADPTLHPGKTGRSKTSPTQD